MRESQAQAQARLCDQAQAQAQVRLWVLVQQGIAPRSMQCLEVDLPPRPLPKRLPRLPMHLPRLLQLQLLLLLALLRARSQAAALLLAGFLLWLLMLAEGRPMLRLLVVCSRLLAAVGWCAQQLVMRSVLLALRWLRTATMTAMALLAITWRVRQHLPLLASASPRQVRRPRAQVQLPALQLHRHCSRSCPIRRSQLRLRCSLQLMVQTRKTTCHWASALRHEPLKTTCHWASAQHHEQQTAAVLKWQPMLPVHLTPRRRQLARPSAEVAALVAASYRCQWCSWR